jgi:hypothetical protein
LRRRAGLEARAVVFLRFVFVAIFFLPFVALRVGFTSPKVMMLAGFRLDLTTRRAFAFGRRLVGLMSLFTLVTVISSSFSFAFQITGLTTTSYS